MYLVEIDEHTGLVKEDKLNDSWKGVKDFIDVVNDKELGLRVFTAIAMTVDYKSLIRHYPINERHKKALRIIPGEKKVNWMQDKIQTAMNTYLEIQYDSSLEEKKLLEELKIKKLEEIKNFEGSDKDRIVLFKELADINNLLNKWKVNNPESSVYDSSPVVNGYKLSRLEQKLLERNSFYNKN